MQSFETVCSDLGISNLQTQIEISISNISIIIGNPFKLIHAFYNHTFYNHTISFFKINAPFVMDTIIYDNEFVPQSMKYDTSLDKRVYNLPKTSKVVEIWVK